MSYSFASLEIEEPETTASITSKVLPVLSADLNEEDWRRAKAALAVALDPQGAGTVVAWDNPETTMKGSFTPSAPPFVKNDEICRAFTAQIAGPVSHYLTGTACRPSGGEWTIKDIKPVNKS